MRRFEITFSEIEFCGSIRYTMHRIFKCNIETLIFLPEYSRYGRAATLVRNTQIIEASDVVVAFPSDESRGTYDSIRKAEKLGKECLIFQI